MRDRTGRSGSRALVALAAFAITGCSVVLGLRDDYALDHVLLEEGGPGSDALASEASSEAGRDSATIDGPSAACTNGTKDGKETDVDCGGSDCLPCANTKTCAVDGDCTSGSCRGSSCQPWLLSAGAFASGSADAFAVAVGANGDIAICGRSKNAIDFGATSLAARGTLDDVIVAKLSANGAVLWAQRFGGSVENEDCYAVAMDAAGNVVIGGTYYDGPSFDLGGGTLPKGGGSDAFVAKLASATGIPQWAVGAGSAGPDRVYGVAVDPSGDVVATGEVGGLASAGGKSIGDSTPSADVFVLKLVSANGFVTWAKTFGSVIGGSKGDDIGRAITTDASGNVFVTGSFRGTTFLFGTSTLTSSGQHDAFVFELDKDGASVWAARYGGSSPYIAAGPEEGRGIAVGANGVFVTGRSTASGAAQTFVAKLALDGGLAWDVVHGGAPLDLGAAISLDPSGNALVSGQFASGTLDFGPDASLTNASGSGTKTDAFLVRLAADGKTLFAERYGTGESDFANGVSARRGNTVVAGTGSQGMTIRGLTVTGQIYVGSLGTLP
jgi:hypothetical protein